MYKKDSYDTGITATAILGIGIVGTLVVIIGVVIACICKFSIRKFGVLATICIGFFLYWSTLLANQIYILFLHNQMQGDIKDDLYQFWEFFLLQIGTKEFEYMCLSLIFCLLFVVAHHAFDFWIL